MKNLHPLPCFFHINSWVKLCPEWLSSDDVIYSESFPRHKVGNWKGQIVKFSTFPLYSTSNNDQRDLIVWVKFENRVYAFGTDVLIHCPMRFSLQSP